MKYVLLWIWCLPQNIAGLIVMLVTKAKRKGDHYAFNVKCGSVSLGEYIFLCQGHLDSEETLRHEKGHQAQSRMLGWLYLPIIGIPSLIWAGCFGWYRKKYNVSYYDFYTESWADQLGGVKREQQ